MTADTTAKLTQAWEDFVRATKFWEESAELAKDLAARAETARLQEMEHAKVVRDARKRLNALMPLPVRTFEMQLEWTEA